MNLFKSVCCGWKKIGDVPSLYHDKVKEILRSLEEDVLKHEVRVKSIVL